jgi:putative oxidoreductase
MKIVTIIARVLLGLMFVVFGSNAFLQFMPMPQMEGYPGQFIGSMAATGYIKVIAALQITGGALLLIGRFVPLGLTLLGPVVVNIVLYHIFMDRAGVGIAAVVTLVTLFLLWRYRAAFQPLLRP